MIPKEVLRNIRRIQLRTSHKVDELLSGNWNSAFKGRGIEFEEVRPYQIGDDVRAIDWNVTARSDQPFIKLFREERELAVMLLVDLSASQHFGTGQQTKREVITELGATLAMSAIKNNDKVGLTLFTDNVEKSIPARKGSRHVLRLIRELLVLRTSRLRHRYSQSDRTFEPDIETENGRVPRQRLLRQRLRTAIEDRSKKTRHHPGCYQRPARSRNAERRVGATAGRGDRRNCHAGHRQPQQPQTLRTTLPGTSGSPRRHVSTSASGSDPRHQRTGRRRSAPKILSQAGGSTMSQRVFSVQFSVFSFGALMLACLVPASTVQAGSVRAAASKSQVQIAEPFSVELTVTAPSGAKVSWPAVGDIVG